MPEPTPDELAARHDDVVRHRGVFDVDEATFERVRSRAGRWGVGAFVHEGARLLLVEEDGRWFLPGGLRETGEPLAAGAAREVHEETGVRVAIRGLAAISEQTFRHAGEAVPFFFATFEGTPASTALADEPPLAGEGIETAAWRTEVPTGTFDRELVTRLADRYLD